MLFLNTARSQLPLVGRHVHTRAPSTTLFPLSSINDEAVKRLEEVCAELAPRSAGDRARALQLLCGEWKETLGEHAGALMAKGSHQMTGPDMLNHHLASHLASALAWAAEVMDHYEPGRMPGEPVCMRPGLANRLKLESGEAFKGLGGERALAYASAIAPELHVDFGIVLTTAQARELSRMVASAGGACLDAQQVLALRDYVHHDTGTFNLLRSLSALRKHLPDEPLTAVVKDVIETFLGAVDLLAASPAFRTEDATVSKGLKLDPFLLHVLERMYSRSLPYEVDRPLSGTVDPAQSYAGRDPAYRHEIVFVNAQAVDVSPFHAPETAGQKEALLLPGQRFSLSSREEVHRREGEGNVFYERFIAEPLSDR